MFGKNSILFSFIEVKYYVNVNGMYNDSTDMQYTYAVSNDNV